MNVETVPLTSLTPDPLNARKHNRRNIDAIKASLSKFGQRKPIVVTNDGTVIAGNGTLEAATSLGWKEISIARAPEEWDENTVRAYALADNQTGALAEWDEKILNTALEDLTSEGWDIAELGFDLNIDVTEPLNGDLDDVPEAPVTPKTQLGDIYQLGRHRLMCGDSTDLTSVERLMNGIKADMVFTDPPYGINFESNDGKSIKNDNLNMNELFEFNKKWQAMAFFAAKDNCFMLAWASPRLLHLLDFNGKWIFFRLLTMYKSNRISFPHGAWINKTEPCLVFTKGKPKISTENYLDDCYVYTHDKESHEDSNVGHPTPKPVKMIIEHISACTKKTELVVDLFGGSGATMIACEKLNRSCYMMELDPKYCDVIVRRWESATGKTAVLL